MAAVARTAYDRGNCRRNTELRYPAQAEARRRTIPEKGFTTLRLREHNSCVQEIGDWAYGLVKACLHRG